jgi:hypothetical protein
VWHQNAEDLPRYARVIAQEFLNTQIEASEGKRKRFGELAKKNAERSQYADIFQRTADHLNLFSPPTFKDFRYAIVELNGTAPKEVLIQAASSKLCGALGCRTWIYRVENDVHESVGQVLGRNLTILETRTNSYNDLETLQKSLVTSKFNGQEYKLVPR